MPPLQIVNTEAAQTPNRAEENLKQLFSKMGEQYREKEGSEALAPIWEQYLENRDKADNHQRTSVLIENNKRLSPTQRLAAQQRLNEIEKNVIAKDKALNKTVSQSLDTYDKERQKKGAQETSELEKKIPQYKNTLQDIDEMERISKESLGSGKGYVKGFFNTQSAKELDTLGASALDPIIKKFNPAGTLPTAKLNWIRETFSPKAAENPSGRQGKINNLRRFTKQALKKDQERLTLLKQYKGLVPSEVLQQFEASETAEYDALADEISFEDKIKDLPDDGKVGGLYDQQGEKLAPIPKKEAVKLFKQGLITNVPQR